MDREQLRKIGFNTTLEADPRRVMIQTEVVGRDEVMIRTRVLHGGVIQSSEKHPQPDATDIDHVRECARIQHERVLGEVRASAPGEAH